MKSLLARLAAVTLLSASVVALPTSTAIAEESCEAPGDVPIVLEFGSLDGEDRVVCAEDAVGTTGLEALNAAGVETEETSGAMPMVCRIDGLPAPEQEKCGNALNGPGYWAFLVAQEGQDWGYATVGLQEYELVPGDFVALKYHLMADGQNVPVDADADASTRAAAEVPGADADHASDEHDDESSSLASVALPIAIVAALLVAVAAFVVARRRRD